MRASAHLRVHALAVALMALATLSGACRKSDPAPKPQPITDAELKQLLRRADDATPKNPPDAQPSIPTDGAEPPPIVIVDGRRPGEAPRTPWYGAPTNNGPSTVENMTRQAEQMFGYRVSSVARRLSSLESLRAQQREACSGSNTLTYGANSAYNPRGVPAGGSTSIGSATYVLDNSVSPQCRSLTGSLAYQESAIRRDQDQIEIDANRAGIYPGVIRDLYARAGMR
jgi:hypothetical protein